MKNATVPLLKQALREMRQHYPDDKVFGNHLVRFHRIMQRSTTMDEQDKQEMEAVLKMEYAYDQLIDDNPDVQKRVERGRAEARLEGRVEGVQKVVLTFIKSRFPTLATLAKQRIGQIQDTDTLEKLFLQLTSAATEDEAREILRIRKASRKKKS